MSGLVEAFLFFGFITMSIILHEVGHYMYFYFNLKSRPNIHLRKKKPFGYSVYVGNDKDYVGLTDQEYMRLSSWGVLFGLVPILFYALINTEIFIIMLLMYIWGCIKDIRNIIIYYKEL